MATSSRKEKCIANASARNEVKIGTINESEVKAKRVTGYFLENQCILIITSNNLRRAREQRIYKIMSTTDARID
jgi:hypothetical protein